MSNAMDRIYGSIYGLTKKLKNLTKPDKFLIAYELVSNIS